MSCSWRQISFIHANISLWTNEDSLIFLFFCFRGVACYFLFLAPMQLCALSIWEYRVIDMFLTERGGLRGLNGQAGESFCWDYKHSVKQALPVFPVLAAKGNVDVLCYATSVVKNCVRYHSVVEEERWGFFTLQHLQKKLNWHLSAEQLWCCSGFKRRAVWHLRGLFLPPLF